MTAATHNALLTIPQAAQRMGVSRNHVYNLMNAGELEFINMAVRKNGPTKKRISEDAIKAFYAARSGRSPRRRTRRVAAVG